MAVARRARRTHSQFSTQDFSQQRNLYSFKREQSPFPLQASRESAESAAGGNNAVARDQHRNRVRAAGAASGADGSRMSGRGGQFGISARASCWNAQEGPPNALLKLCRAVPVKWGKRSDWLARQRGPQGVLRQLCPTTELGAEGERVERHSCRGLRTGWFLNYQLTSTLKLFPAWKVDPCEAAFRKMSDELARFRRDANRARHQSPFQKMTKATTAKTTRTTISRTLIWVQGPCGCRAATTACSNTLPPVPTTPTQ
jgi:hypothetical protein